MSDEQARPLDLEMIEKRLSDDYAGVLLDGTGRGRRRAAVEDVAALVAEVRALRAERWPPDPFELKVRQVNEEHRRLHATNERLARDLAAARAALAEAKTVLKGYYRSAWDGNNQVDLGGEDGRSLEEIIEAALGQEAPG